MISEKRRTIVPEQKFLMTWDNCVRACGAQSSRFGVLKTLCVHSTYSFCTDIWPIRASWLSQLWFSPTQRQQKQSCWLYEFKFWGVCCWLCEFCLMCILSRVVSMMDPDGSWVARWQHINGKHHNVTCISHLHTPLRTRTCLLLHKHGWYVQHTGTCIKYNAHVLTHLVARICTHSLHYTTPHANSQTPRWLCISTQFFT